MNLSKNIKIEHVLAFNDTAGTTDGTGADVDFTGYDGVLFFVQMQKATATTNTNQLKIEQKSGTTYTPLDGATAVCTVDGQVLAVDVYRPLESQGKILRGIAETNTSSEYGDMYAILYNGRIKPETVADVATLVISPVVTS